MTHPTANFIGETEKHVYARNKKATDGLLARLKSVHEVEPVVELVEPPKPVPPKFKEPWFSIVAPLEPQEPRKLLIADIQSTVAEHYDISRADMLSARRTKNVMRPRQVGYYLAKALTGRSLPEIGRRFGGRDHTTILSGIRKIERLLLTDEELAARVAIIEAELTA